MQHVASVARPTESIFTILASCARKLSDVKLGSIAVASGVTALAAARVGVASWGLLGACYIAWCFAGWGIVFRPKLQRSAPWRGLELLIVGSGTAVLASLGVTFFFWALGSHWQL